MRSSPVHLPQKKAKRKSPGAKKRDEIRRREFLKRTGGGQIEILRDRRSAQKECGSYGRSRGRSCRRVKEAEEERKEEETYRR